MVDDHVDKDANKKDGPANRKRPDLAVGIEKLKLSDKL